MMPSLTISDILNSLKNSKNFSTFGKCCFVALMAITLLSIFFDGPGMPAFGNDESWQYAMGEALAKNFVIGKEIIFTYGPYAILRTHQFHPASANLELLGGLYLTFCYLLVILALMKGSQLRWCFALWAMIAFCSFEDEFFFSYPLMAGLTIFRLIFADKNSDKINLPSWLSPIFIFVIASPLGLLPLVKGSYILICVAAAALYFAMLCYDKKIISALFAAISPIISIILFWLLAKQPLVDLPTYFVNISQIISGYTETMSVTGAAFKIVVYLAAVPLILYAIYANSRYNLFLRLILMSLFSAFLFIAFKSGYVRNDAHVVTAANAIIIAALLLPFVLKNEFLIIKYRDRHIHLLLPLILIAFLLLNKDLNRLSPSRFANNINNHKRIYDTMKTRIAGRDELINVFSHREKELKEQAAIPLLKGTSDIYTFDLSHLIASGNKWSPRPVFQSYSAYTEKLAQINANHLLGEKAPDNIIFRLATLSMDERFPSIDDGLSWPILLQNYTPIQAINDASENSFLILRKNQTVNSDIAKEAISESKHKFKEVVKMTNQDDQIIFAEIEIEQSFFGRLFSILFKPGQLQINLTLVNGNQKSYRISSTMTKSGFVISPLVTDTTEFGLLYDKGSYLKGNAVKSFSIFSRSRSNLWNKSAYKVKLSHIKSSRNKDFSKMIKFDKFSAYGSSYRSDENSSACRYNFKINNYSISDDGGVVNDDTRSLASVAELSVPIANIKGWAVVADGDKIKAQDGIFFIFTDLTGNSKYLKTHVGASPDLVRNFNNPQLENNRFAAYADLSSLKGDQIMRIGYFDKSQARICNKLIPITF